MRLYSMSLFTNMTGFFHLACFHSSSCCSIWTLSLLWLENIPLHGYSTIYLSIHQLIGLPPPPTCWLLWIMLLWTFVYKFLSQHVLISFGINLEVELLGHMITWYLTFWGTSKLFSKVAAPCYIPINSVWGFLFLHILVSTCHCLSFVF